MKHFVIITHVATATVASMAVYGLLRHPQETMDRIPTNSLPARVHSVQHVQTAKVHAITWKDLDSATTIPEFVGALHRFGIQAPYIQALVPVKATLLASSTGDYHTRRTESPEDFQRRAILEANEALAKLEPGATAKDRLNFLSPERREAVSLELASYDVKLREMETRANGVFESEDWQKYEEAKKARQQAMLQALTPGERQLWITQQSPEADELRDRQIDLTKEQFDAIALAQYEANRALESDSIGDPERNQIKAGLAAKLEQTLGKSGYTQFQRTEDPGYNAFHNLTVSLGIDLESANYVFDWQRCLRQEETNLRLQNLPEEEIVSRMKPLADKAKAAIQVRLGDAFQKLGERPQGIFLAAYEPLVEE